MKKILFLLLLCTVSIYGQTTTGQEQEFDYGIKNNSTQTITTPPYLTTTGMDGTQGKIPSALIEKTDNKQNSLAVDGTGTKYPTVDAVNAKVSNIDNTSDANKPVSTATQTALDGKQATLGFTPENVANKTDSYTASSSTTYASTKALVDGLGTKQNTLTNPVTGVGTTNTIPKWTGTTTQGNSSITDNGSLVTITNPTTFIGLNTIQGTVASDGGQLGSELTTTATGTNWTGTGFATGYTHTTGNVTPLVSTLAAVANNLYQITWTITGRTTGSVRINYGGIAITGITSSGNSGPKTTSTATLNIIPTTDFNGTIVLSIKVISASVATTIFKNSSGAVVNEIRAHSSSSNISLGLNAGKSNTTGSGNSAVGQSALLNNTTGSGNSAVGQSALLNNTTGSGNSAVGADALLNNTTGIRNSAVGQSALRNNTTGSGNSAVGIDALLNNTTGIGNSAVGQSALRNNTTGSGNSAVGADALLNNTTGSSNSAFGRDASIYIADKSTPATILNNSVMLGYRTSPLADNQTNQIVIGYDAIGLGSNSTVIGNSSTTTARVYGRQLVNTSTDNGIDQLQVNGTISASPATLPNQVVTKAQLDLKENLANKQNSLAVDGTGTKYPTVDAVVEGIKLNSIDLWTSTSYPFGKVVKHNINDNFYLFQSNLSDNTTTPQLEKGVQPFKPYIYGGSYVGVWSAGSYVAGNIVSRDSFLYYCLTNTETDPQLLQPPYWLKIGVDEGVFNPSKTDGYKLGDAVRDISNNVYTSQINFNTFPLLTLTNNAWDLFNGQPLNIATWGDSLTAGTGSNGNANYPSVLSSLSGLNVFNGGIAAETSTQIKTRFLSDKSKWSLPTIFWVGRNNYTDGVTVKADIAEMVSKLGHSNYLVVGIIKATSDAAEPINTLNSDLKTIYGDRFVDMQPYLLSIYNPSIPQDVIDHGNGVIAWSMRSDWLHLSNLGYSYVAKLLNTKIAYMLGRDKQVTSNITSTSIQITGNEQGLQPVKGVEILYDTVQDIGVIDAYDRVTSTVKPLSIQYPLGSELRLVEQGGNVKIGDLPNYTTGSMYQLGLTTATLGILQRLPSGSTGRISKWTAQGVQGDSHFAETSNQISTPSGVGLSIGSTDYYIPPSATEGVLNVGGSSAQFITLSNNAYLYGSNTLTRLLSERDFDMVIGSVQRMAIDKLTGIFKINSLSGIGSRLVTADASGNLSAPTIPTAPTAAVGTNTTQIATTAFVQTAKASVLSDDNTFTGSQVFNDTVNFNNIALLKSYTVSTLPTGMIRGAIAYVTDALAPTYMTTVVGGGSVVCPVFYNGTAWVAH